MRYTAKERVKFIFSHFAKKSRLLRVVLWPIFVLAMIVLTFATYFFRNMKKEACIGSLCLFFVMCSSFSFPLFENLEVSQKPMILIADTRVGKAAADLPQEEILDDDDVMDGYEDVEFEHVDNLDKYSLDEILAESSSSVNATASSDNDAEENTKKPAEQSVSVPSDYVFDKNDWRLLLINKQHPVPDDYHFELGIIKGAMRCDTRIIDDLVAMLQGAKEDGVNLVICSPYRDMNRQTMLFERKIEAYMARGYSYMEAYKTTAHAVTVPGASEHQIGLALDIICDTYASLNEGFGETEAGKWLKEHSAEYGFTLRYPKGKEYITGIEYEPWHFRYVGREAATVMKEKDICLEEFVERL